MAIQFIGRMLKRMRSVFTRFAGHRQPIEFMERCMGRQCDLAGFALRTPPIMSATLCAVVEQATSEPSRMTAGELQSLRPKRGGCYLTTNSPFRAHTLFLHQECGRRRPRRRTCWSRTRNGHGVEFLRAQRAGEQSQRMIATLHANEKNTPKFWSPDGMNRQRPRTAWRPCKRRNEISAPKTRWSICSGKISRAGRNLPAADEGAASGSGFAIGHAGSDLLSFYVSGTYSSDPTSLTVPRCSR